MKKILALVLAALMVLTAVSALATDSKGGGDMNYGSTEEGGEISLIKGTPDDKLNAIIEQAKAAGGDGAAVELSTISGGLISGEASINEMDCYQLVGDTENAKEQELTFHFATPFEDGADVTLLLGISPAEGDVEWLSLDGKANADGDVVVKVTPEQFKKIGNNPFLVIPVVK